MTAIKRQQILERLTETLQAQEYGYGLWSGGAMGFDRVDEWSEIDLIVIAAEEQVQDVFPVVAAVLETLAPIEIKYEVPQPAWHGHYQTFYRLRDASPYLLIHLAVMKFDNPDNHFLEAEIHGQPQVLFDKKGLTTSPPVDQEQLLRDIQTRIEQIRGRFELFQVLVLKELKRGNGIEAISFYYKFTLRPLVELLRIHHCPLRNSFATRYLHYDLPLGILEKLEPLFHLSDQDELQQKYLVPTQWVKTLLADFELDAVRNALRR